MPPVVLWINDLVVFSKKLMQLPGPLQWLIYGVWKGSHSSLTALPHEAGSAKYRQSVAFQEKAILTVSFFLS
jgi:hypothetical protein